MFIVHLLHLLTTAVCWTAVTAGQRQEVTITPAVNQIDALSTDVAVVVRDAARFAILELYFDNEAVPLTGQVIIQEAVDTALIFDCAYFSRIGIYTFRYRPSLAANISSSVSINAVKYPEFSVKLKATGQLLSTDVEVETSYARDSAICMSDLVKRTQVNISVLHHDSIDAAAAVNVASHLVTFPPPRYTVFPCELFSSPGTYRAQLSIVVRARDHVMARSDHVPMQWSSDYDLVFKQRLFACKQQLAIRVKRPPCAPPTDIIQAVARGNNGSSYVIANTTVGNRDRVHFACSEFSSLREGGVCFRYITTSDAVVKTSCQPVSQFADFHLDGGWSAWSAWSMCSRPCNRSVRRRSRECDNPRPHGLLARPCRDSGAARDTVDVEYVNVTSPPEPGCAPNWWRTPARCECGCFIKVLDGGLLTSPIAGQCNGENTTLWRMFAPPRHVVTFRMVDYQLGYGEHVTVSDGRRSVTMTSARRGGNVTSTGNEVAVRYTRSSARRQLSCGFVLAFSIVEKKIVEPTAASENQTKTVTDSNRSLDHRSVNPVMMAGVTSCLLLIVVVITVAIIRCHRRRKTVERRNLSVRMTSRPDGKSSSNIDEQSDEEEKRGGGGGGRCERVAPVGSSLRSFVAPNSPGAYYLAQRQLQLMKKVGQQGSTQVYDLSCMNARTVREQQALLFGDLSSSDAARQASNVT